MGALLGQSLAAGGMGFSSSWARAQRRGGRPRPVPPGHPRGDRGPVPRRPGARGHRPRFIPMIGEFEDWAMEIMTDMSLAANRPLNWNILVVLAGLEAAAEHQLTAGDRCRRAGGWWSRSRSPTASRPVSASPAGSCSTRFPAGRRR